MTWQPPQKVGDRDPAIVEAKRKLHKYSYGQGLGDTDEYTPEFGVALRQFQVIVHHDVLAGKRPPPDVATAGALDWATKKQLGMLGAAVPQKPKAVVFTVEGHMSSMWVGPCADSGRALEQQGIARWQPVGYNNTALPFDNDSGVNELHRLVNDPKVLAPGEPWGLVIYSQGGIVGSRFYLEHIRPNQDRAPYNTFRGCVAYGNPMREKNQIAFWVPAAQQPRLNTQGIADVRMDNTPQTWKEVTRRGDLFAENTADEAREWKTAVYEAVQSNWVGGPNAIFHQLLELGISPTQEVVAVVFAIISGLTFVGSSGAHYGAFDVRPGIDHMRRCLS